MKMPEAKAGVVPELRFPKFRDAGPWEVKSIADLSERIAQGGTPATSVAEYWNGGIPWITPAEMGDDAATHYTSATVRTISAEGLRNSSAELLPVNSVIISSRAPIGYVTINSVEMATNQGCKGIVPCADVHHEFLYFGLLNAKTRLNDIGAGAGFKEISTSSLAAFQIPVPSLPEQQQIADCLTSLDDLIRAEEGRLAALRAHKTGLMQRLFPAPGQTAPRLRFPEFRDAGPWEVKLLGEIYRFKPTNSWPRDRLKYEGGTIKNIHYGDIHKGLSSTFRIADEVVPFLDEGLTAAISEEALCGPSDIVFADASEDVADIGKAIEIVDIGDEKLVSGLHTILASQIDRKLIIGFGAYLFASAGIRAQIQQRAQGAKVLGISKSQLAEITLAYPKHEPEQQKIADCLTALDDLIRAQGETIAALKAHKTALMQKLFPREVG